MSLTQLIVIGLLVALGLIISLRLAGMYWRSRRQAARRIVCLKIKPNYLNEKSPQVAEQIFSALHGIYEEPNFLEKIIGKDQERISMEMANIDGKIYFFLRLSASLADLVTSQFYANYPQAEIEKVADYTREKHFSSLNAHGIDLELSSSSLWPIRRYSQFEDQLARVFNDPLAGILSPLVKLSSSGDQFWLQTVFSPVSTTKFRRRAAKALRILHKGHYKNSHFLRELFERNYLRLSFFKRLLRFPLLLLLWILRGGSGGDSFQIKERELDLEMSRRHDREDNFAAASDKITRTPFQVTVRILYLPEVINLPSIKQKLTEALSGYKQFSIPELNGFQASKIRRGKAILKEFQEQAINDLQVLSAEELATIAHLPNNTVEVPSIDWVLSRKLEPPSNLPVITRTAELKNDLTAIGKTNFRGKNQNFGIKADDRRRHLYIVGKTGMGKSTLLENMIFSDITSGKGVAVIDPHGDLAEAVIDFVPASRTNDVIIFDPADSEFPVSFNMLEAQNPANRHLVASGIVGVFKKIFADSWGPRLEHILRNTLLALVEAPNTSMLGVMRMLVDNKYRSQVLNSVKDPMVLNFWNQEFGAWNPKQVAEAISPIQNKVGQFLSSPLVRNILGQTKSTIDLRFAMDKRKIIIVNLSKGKIGEDNSALLGSMLVTKFQLDVMSRADIGESEREDFYLYVDEFQNFATDSFATILSEARKYKLNLTVANQYLAQMPDTVREAVFGNVGSLLSFQVGFDDAEDIANQLGGEAQMITAQDLATLPKYQIYLRQMIDGMPSKTFSANTLPPPEFEAEGGRREKLIKVSRERYSKERGLVEEKIIKWANN